ncbi:hypothetical protein [Rhodobacteraceae bacterium DSL-40]|uniref:hypothetical protein n=1 Tax=Amaricoccus sp. B4 TaxID=3368557 RepID=UPI000DAC83DC
MIGIWREGNQVTAAVLKSGVEVKRGRIVNASSPHEALTACVDGLDIPVEPRTRTQDAPLLSQVAGHWYACRTGIPGSALRIAKPAI